MNLRFLRHSGDRLTKIDNEKIVDMLDLSENKRPAKRMCYVELAGIRRDSRWAFRLAAQRNFIRKDPAKWGSQGFLD